MTKRRTPRSVQMLDQGKFIALLVFIVALAGMLAVRSCRTSPPLAITLTPIPTYTAVVEVVRPLLQSPRTGAQIAAGEVQVSGSADAGSRLRILIDGAEVATTTVPADGLWSLPLPLDQAGAHSVRVQLLDETGAVITEAEPVVLRVNVPVVSVQAPSLDSAIIEQGLTSGQFTLAGAGEPGTQLQVVVNGEIIGSAEVQPDGSWSLEAALRESGDYAVALRTLVGEQVVATATAVSVSLATTGEGEVPAQPLTSTGVISSVSAIASSVISAQVVASSISATLSLPSFERIPLQSEMLEGSQAISGNGQPGQRVQVLIGGVPVGAADVGDDGRWVITPTLGEIGVYSISLRTLDADGGVLAESAPQALPLFPPSPTDTPEPTATATETVEPTATSTSTETPEPTATATETVEPTAASTSTETPEPTATATETVDPTATSTSTETPEPTATATETVEPTATSTSTETPEPTATATETVEPTATSTSTETPEPTKTPIPPSLDTSTIQAALVRGEQSFSGTGQPGQVIELVANGTPIGQVTVDDDGAWSLAAALPSAGAYSLSLRSLDTSGALLAESTPLAIKVVESTIAATPTETVAPTSTPTWTETAQPTATATETPKPTNTPTETVAPTSTPTWTETAQPTATATETPKPTSTPTETVAPTATSTSTDTPKPTATATKTPKPTNTPTETVAPTSTSTSTVTPKPTATATKTLKPTNTPTETVAPTATSTSTDTPKPTATATKTPKPTNTPTETVAPTSTPTWTETAQPTAKATKTPKPTNTPTETVASTSTPTWTETAQPTATATVTVEPTATSTSTDTPKPTATATKTPKPTNTPTETVAPTSTPTETVAPTSTSTSTPMETTEIPSFDEMLVQAALAGGGEVISGNGEAGQIVGVLVNGELIGRTKVDADGVWAFRLPQQASNVYILTVAALDEAGQPLAESAPLLIRAPTPTPSVTASKTALPTSTPTETRQPTATATSTSTPTKRTATETPTMTAVPSNTPTETVQPTNPPTDTREPTATATSTIAPTKPPTATPIPPNLDVDALHAALASGDQSVRGAGQPGQVLELLVDGVPIGRATVDDDGVWSLVAPLPSAGAYSLSLRSLDASGALLAVSTPLAINGPEPTVIPTPTKKPAMTPTATSTREPTATVDPTDTPTKKPANTPTVTSAPPEMGTSTDMSTPTEPLKPTAPASAADAGAPLTGSAALTASQVISSVQVAAQAALTTSAAISSGQAITAGGAITISRVISGPLAPPPLPSTGGEIAGGIGALIAALTVLAGLVGVEIVRRADVRRLGHRLPRMFVAHIRRRWSPMWDDPPTRVVGGCAPPRIGDAGDWCRRTSALRCHHRDRA